MFIQKLLLQLKLKNKKFKKSKRHNSFRRAIDSYKKKFSKYTKKNFFQKKIPILGICYGLQLIAKLFGGKIKSSKKEENLEEHIFLKKKSLLTKNFLSKKRFCLDEP